MIDKLSAIAKLSESNPKQANLQLLDLAKLLKGSQGTLNARINQTFVLNEQSAKQIVELLGDKHPISEQIKQHIESQVKTNTALSIQLNKLLVLVRSDGAQQSFTGSAQNYSTLGYTWALTDKLVPQNSLVDLQLKSGVLTFKTHAPTPNHADQNLKLLQQSSLAYLTANTAQKLSSTQQQTIQQAIRSYLPQTSLPTQPLLTSQANAPDQFTSNSTAHDNSLKSSTLLSQNILNSKALNQSDTQTLLNLAASSNALKNMPELSALINALNTARTISALIPPISDATPADVKGALKNSGVFLENKLFNNLIHILQIHKGSLNVNAPQDGLETAIESDQKAFMLQLLNLSSLLSSSVTARTPNASENTLIDGLLRVLFLGKQATPRSHSPSETNKNNERIKLIRAIERFASASIANSTLNQLSTLQNQSSDGQNNHCHFDLLFRMNEYLIPVHGQIDYNDKNETNLRDKKRNWRFILDWSFPDSGRFNADIRLTQQAIQHGTSELPHTEQKPQLSYTFWVENKNIQEKMKNEIKTLLSELKDKGVLVTNCSFSPTPIIEQSKRRSSQSLIDIKT